MTSCSSPCPQSLYCIRKNFEPKRFDFVYLPTNDQICILLPEIVDTKGWREVGGVRQDHAKRRTNDGNFNSDENASALGSVVLVSDCKTTIHTVYITSFENADSHSTVHVWRNTVESYRFGRHAKSQNWYTTCLYFLLTGSLFTQTNGTL